MATRTEKQGNRNPDKRAVKNEKDPVWPKTTG